jgi:hypothetical protein
MGVLILLVVVMLFALLVNSARRQRDRKAAAAATVYFSVDGDGVERRLADGREEAVTWDELNEVTLLVLPKGPWGDRVRFVLDGGGLRGCIVPRHVAIDGGLLDRLAALPGFDHRALAEALGQERTGSTVLWSRDGSRSTSS